MGTDYLFDDDEEDFEFMEELDKITMELINAGMSPCDARCDAEEMVFALCLDIT